MAEKQEHPSMEEEESFLRAMQLSTSLVLPLILRSSFELNLFELIKKLSGSKGSISSEELAVHLPTSNPKAPIFLDRILFFLSSYSILNCTLQKLPQDGRTERRYSLAPICNFLTKDEDNVSLAYAPDTNTYRGFMGCLSGLKDAILDGESPFVNSYGMSTFEYQAANQAYNQEFNQLMSNNSTIIMKKVLQNYCGFEGSKIVVDVGGGFGATLNMIISKHPSMKGVNFDLPHVIRDAPSYPGIVHVGGDIFVSVPKGDTIFMKHVLHDWGDEHCLKILKNCYEALPIKGKVVVVDIIVPEVPSSSLASRTATHMDIIMLAVSPGGKERTENEFEAMANKAGFKEFRKVSGAYNHWILEFLK